MFRPVALLLCVLLAVTVVLSGCQASIQSMVTPVPAAPSPVPGKLTVVDAMARPAPLAGGNGAVYFRVFNGLAGDVQLLSVSSPASEVAELHETVDDGGVMRMIPHPEGFTVPAGASVELKPGGKHVMLLGLVKPLAPGDAVQLVLDFSSGESITITSPVVDMTGVMAGTMAEQMPMDMTDHGNSMSAESHDHEEAMDADVAGLAARLPVSDLHQLDELLATGKSDAKAADAVGVLLKALENPLWPEEMHSQIGEIRELATELQTALDAGDLTAAAPLASQLHGLVHELEHEAGQH